MNEQEQAALERLLDVARSDTGQSSRCANFLLAWWNATSCGGFDFTDLWMVDGQLADDMLTVAGLICRANCYPGSFGYGADFEQLVELWRPDLVARRETAAQAS